MVEALHTIETPRSHLAKEDKAAPFRHLSFPEKHEIYEYLQTRIRVMNPEELDRAERLCSYIDKNEDDETVAEHFNKKFSCSKAQVMSVRMDMFGSLFKKSKVRTPKGEGVLLELIEDLQDEVKVLKEKQAKLLLWASFGSAHPFKG